MLQIGTKVNLSTQAAKGPVQKPAPGHTVTPKARLQALLAVPVAASVALAVHQCLPNNELLPEAHLYSSFLGGILGTAIAALAVQILWAGLRGWMQKMCPIFAAAILTLC